MTKRPRPGIILVKVLLLAVSEIAAEKTPFTPVGERKDGNRTIYELNGMGQKHYYFQSGKLLVWLAADVEIAQEAIRETLKFYP